MIEIIPAIDIIGGKCVRLTKGDYTSTKVYNENPLEVAKAFEAHGIKRLHLVDLDGAKAQHIVNYHILEQIATKTSLTIDFGGGLKTDEDLKIAFSSGAKMITGGSIAIKNPELFKSWITIYGNEKIILGADVKNEKIAVSGWYETSNCNLIAFLNEYTQVGISKVICTDIEKDGTLQGTATDLYKKILNKFPNLHLIASGGVAQWDDLEILEKIGIQSVIIGKAIYEGNITLSEIEKYIIK
ncbi:MAG: 1-(5-phosphoribosyl)-5-[(5-phosphoribosylamino)methylideneamino]imidazole-4-carboxamide isomerase [Paludibacteraceae bacterium]|jgi:phosphoribosylformimino-5-aminoimidazole carboxamide ribotide isomerase|nr:1-(5-phosphoribosyl)-5-[(5-phosphoribosylamino)methylideneamino]imidazole-4-carboxamide isomerase [Paludibacteraceae bacterium]